MASGSSYAKRAPEAQRFHHFLLDRYGVDSGLSYPQLGQARKEYSGRAGEETRRTFSTHEYRVLLIKWKGIRKRGKRENAIHYVRPASDWISGGKHQQTAEKIETRRPKKEQRFLHGAYFGSWKPSLSEMSLSFSIANSKPEKTHEGETRALSFIELVFE